MAIEGSDGSSSKDIDRILACYRALDGKPVSQVTLVKFGGKVVWDELTNEQIDTVRDLIECTCFTALARREFFLPMNYCNTDCFTYYGHKFTPGTEYTAVVSKRRDGRSFDTRPLAVTVFTVPPNASGIHRVDFDEELSAALLAFSTAHQSEWGSWQNALSCFNQANSDNEAYRYQSEWVLMCGAFERLLGADSKAEDVASKFAEVFSPTEPLTIENVKTRESQRWRDPKRHLRFEWMREFYSVRGDFAHGKLDTRQPMAWNPLEHLFLASLAFPLTVKSILHRMDLFKAPSEAESNEEIKNVLKPGGSWRSFENFEMVRDGFESLAAHPDFLTPLSDQKGSMDSHWARIMGEVQSSRLRAALTKLLERGDGGADPPKTTPS